MRSMTSFLCACLPFAQTLLAVRQGGRPNIVFILTDDQDSHMNSLDYMPITQQHLIKAGTTFARHYCTGKQQ